MLPRILGRLPRRGFKWTAGRPKLVQFLLSDIGEGIREVTVAEWHVKPGDRVAQFDSICSVESDKASVNITSRYDGEIKKLYYETGDKALVGQPLVDIDTPDSEESSSAESSQQKSQEPPPPTEVTPPPPASPPPVDKAINETPDSTEQSERPLTTPAVRRIAKEHGIPLNQVPGSGKAGRITKEDVLAYIAKPAPEAPQSQPVTSTRGDTVLPLTSIARAMFNSMTIANTIPTFNYHEEVSVTELARLRDKVKEAANQKGVKLTMLPFFMKALSLVIEDHPRLNASADGENLILHGRHNIGFAVASKLGLAVPNVKDVQDKSVLQVAREIDRILAKGRLGKFQPNDLSGGTISVSNIGSMGGVGASPLLLPPQVMIVAFCKVQRRPVFAPDGSVVAADILPSSWAADHRFIDGASLAAAVTAWQRLIENPSLLLLGL